MTLALRPNSGLGMIFTVPTAFTNNGTMTMASAAAETVTLSSSGGGTITNAGLLTINAGGSGNPSRAVSGTLINSATGTFNINANTQLNGTSNAGNLTISPGSTVSFASSSNTFNQTGGTLTVNGALNLSGNRFNYAGGDIAGTVTMGGFSTLDIGASSGNSGTFLFSGSGSTILGNVKSGQALNVVPSTGAGVIATVDTAFTNSGAITLGSAGTETVTLSSSGGGTITNVGTLSINAGGSGSPTRAVSGTLINNSGATLTVGASTTFNGVTNNGNFTISPGSTVSFASSSNTYTQAGGTLTVGGALNLSGNRFKYTGGNIGGTVTMGGFATLDIGAGSGNSGTFVLPGSGSTILGNVKSGQTLNVMPSTGAGVIATVDTAFTNSGAITLGSAAAETVTLSSSGGGTITNVGSLSISAGGSGTPTRALSGTLINNAAASVSLGASTTLNTVTNNGTFNIASGATASFASSSNTYTQAGGMLTVGGALNLSGNRFNYTGGDIVGTITLAGFPTLDIGTGSGNSGTFLLNGSGATLTGNVRSGQTVNVAPSTGAGVIVTVDSGFTNGGTVAMSSATTEAVTLSTAGSITNAGLLTIQPGGNRAIGAGTFITGSGGVTNVNTASVFNNLTNSAGGTLNVSGGAITFNGASNSFVQNGGTVAIAAGGQISVPSGGAVFTGGTMGLASSAGTAGQFTLGGSLNNTGATAAAVITSTGGNANPGQVNLANGTRTFNIADATAGSDLVVAATIANGSMAKAGAGTLELTGNNTFTGATQLQAGTIRAVGGNALSDSANVNFTTGGTNPRLEIAGGNEVIGNLSSTIPTAAVSVEPGATLTTGSGTLAVTFAAVVSGAGAVVKQGGNQWSLTGTSANTLSGLTSVNAGTLRLAKTAGVNAVAGNVTVNSGGTLLWAAGEQIADTATLTLNSGGTLNLAGNTETVGAFVDNGGTTVLGGGSINVVGGDVTLTDGTVIATNVILGRDLLYTGTTAAATVSGNIALDNTNVTHNFNIANGAAATDVVITGAISGSTNVNKTGAGTLRLGGTSPNLYTGTTTVTGGVLELDKSSQPAIAGPLNIAAGGTVRFLQSHQIADSAAVNIAAGATLDLNGQTDHVGSLSGGGNLVMNNGVFVNGLANRATTFAGVISGGGQFAHGGQGTLTLTGNNTYDNIWYFGGPVSVGSAANLGTALVLIENGGSLRAMSSFTTPNNFHISGAGGPGTIEVDATRTLTLTGNFVVAPGATGEFIKSGAGAVVISGSAPGSYDGSLRIDAGTFAVAGARQLDADVQVTVNTGGTFNLSAQAVNQTIAVLQGAGNVVLGTNSLTAQPITPATFSGQISGPGSLGVGGDNTTNLFGSANIGGALRVTDGATLNAIGAGEFTVGSLDVSHSDGAPTFSLGASLTAANAKVHGGGLTGAQMNVTTGGAVLNVPGTFYVGGDNTGPVGTGTVTFGDGTTSNIGTLKIWNGGGSAVNLAGGSLTVATLDTSSDPSGFAFNGGTLRITSSLTVSDTGPLGNTLTLSGASTLETHGLNVTDPEFGATLNVETGGILLTLAGTAAIQAVGGGGFVNVSGTDASWTLAPGVPLTIGNVGTGELNIASGGSVTVSDSVFVGGNGSFSDGYLTVGGLGRLVVGGDVHVGRGSVAGSTGPATMTVGNNAVAEIGGSLYSYDGYHVQVLSGGTVNATGVALDTGSSIDAPAVTIHPDSVLRVGTAGITTAGGDIDFGISTVAAGTLQLGGDFTYTASANAADIVSPSFAAGDLPGVVDLLGETRTFNVANGSQVVDVSVSAVITNGGVTKTGLGTLSLSGPNDYAGETSVQGGRLDVEGGSLPTATALSVDGSAQVSFGADDAIASLAGAGAVFLNGNSLTVGDETGALFAGSISGGGSGKLAKVGDGTWTVSGGIAGVSGVAVSQGVLRLSGPKNSLAGTIDVTGTGPTFGTLALDSNSIGSATLNLAGGRVRYESSTTIAYPITLGVGGGNFEIPAGQAVAINTPLAGAGGLTKSGPGIMRLGAVATYDGQTTITAGTLEPTVPNAIPAASEVAVAAGATLSLTSRNQTIASLAGGGAVTFAGATLTVGGNDATTNFSGSMIGAGALVKNGAGAMTLSGVVDLSGAMNVNAGSLVLAGTNTSGGGIHVGTSGTVAVASTGRLGAASNVVTLTGGTLHAAGTFASPNPVTVTPSGGAIDVDATHTLTQNGSLAGAGTLSKRSDGTLQISSGMPLTGLLNVDAGRLLLREGAKLAGVPQFHVASGATLELDNSLGNNADRIAPSALRLKGGTLKLIGVNGGLSSESAGTLQLAAGSSAIVLQQGVSGGTTQLNFSALNREEGATLDLVAPGAGLTNTLFIGGVPTGFMGGWATVDGSDFAKYDPARGVVPLEASDYSNDFGAGVNVRLTSSRSGSGAASSLTLDASATDVNVPYSGTMSLSGGGVLKSGSKTASIGGLSGQLGSTSGRLDIYTAGGGGDLTIASALVGAMNLTKSGAGALALANAGPDHSFTGSVFLNAGTLRIASDANLGASGAAIGNDLVFNGGTLQPIGAAVTLGSGRTLTFDEAGGTLDVAGASLTSSTTNQLAGADALRKTGTGVFSINAANAFIGPVTIQQGTLALGHTGALGSSSDRSTITLAPSATLDLRSDGPFPANFGNDVIVKDNTPATPATITTGSKSGPTAGEFRLGNLDIGKATLATGGPGGSLNFTGIVTLTGEAAFNAGRNLAFSDRVTGGGSLTKLGTGKLTLGSGASDTAANTYAGVTNIAGGVLELNKAAGTIAIPGDILMSGGTLVLLQPRQIADNSALLLTGGTFDLGGQNDAIQTLNNAGANVVVNGATLTVGTTTISGGTTTIGAPPVVPAPGGASLNGGAEAVVTSTMVTDTLNVSDGTTIVNPGGSLEVRSGGLFFSGVASPTITLVNDAANPGRLLLRGDVTSSTTAGVATIASQSNTPLTGTIDMGDVTRTLTVSSAASDLRVTGKLTHGGIRKSGPGKLVLTAASDYTLGVTVVSGTVEAHDGALGTGPVTLSGGNLNLRSNAPLSRFGNDLTTGTSTVDIDRISGAGVAGTMQLGRLSIGANRLRVRGLNGGALEFTGSASLIGGTSIIDNTVPVVFSNVIIGTGSLTKDFGVAALTFNGQAANTYTGTTRVNSGTLILAKSAGVTAVAGNVEAFTGGAVEWQADDQIADTASLTVNGSASRIDLKNNRDTVASVDLTGGTLASGTGLLRVTGSLTSYPSTVTANITGNLELTAGMHMVNTTNVPKTGGAPVGGTAVDDLVIAANISGLGGITKIGTETLVLSGNNSFTGGVLVQGGTLKNIGATQLTGATSLDVSTSLELPGNFTTAPGSVVTKSGAGTLSITGPQSHGAGAQLVVQQGSVSMTTDAGSAANRNLAVNAAGGSISFGASEHLASLTVASGVTATVTPGGGKAVVLDALSVADTAKVNLNDNVLIVTAGAVGSWNGSAYTGLTGKIVSAYNGGAWNGNGVTTGMSDALAGLTSLAIGNANDVLGGAGTFRGHDVPAGATLIAHTYAGDANMDGFISGDDYSAIDFNIAASGASGWGNGDFNYDGIISGDDYSVIDFNIVAQGSPFGQASTVAGSAIAELTSPSARSASLGAVIAVPEPGSMIAALGAISGTILRRRRRSFSTHR